MKRYHIWQDKLEKQSLSSTCKSNVRIKGQIFCSFHARAKKEKTTNLNKLIYMDLHDGNIQSPWQLNFRAALMIASMSFLLAWLYIDFALGCILLGRLQVKIEGTP